VLGPRHPQRRQPEGQAHRQEPRPGARRTGTRRAGGQGGGVVVDPHLCVGCGACSTVCPSGAMSFAYPGPVDQGKRLRTLLQTYARAGGRDAALLLHSEGAGARLIDDLGRAARSDRRSTLAQGGLHGVPARVLPVALWHTASVGLDLWLAAKAQGASQVWVLLTDEEAPEYRRPWPRRWRWPRPCSPAWAMPASTCG
jgi:ferredoxin